MNPAPVESGMQPAGPAPGAAEVFGAAGLELGAFTPASLARSPLGVTDQVQAWKGQVTEIQIIRPWMTGPAGIMHPVLTGGMIGILFEIAAQGMLFGTMVTWSRVLAGRSNDPQVWAHVLIGGAAGLALQRRDWVATLVASGLFAARSGAPSGRADWLASYLPWGLLGPLGISLQD